jgi:hypothetical protein
MRSSRLGAVAVALVVWVGFSGYAGAAGAGTPLVRVSGPSPYAACSASDPNDVVYPNAEVEPDVASNPVRPSNLIAVWQQDRWAGGGAHGLMAGYSFDGGRTWGRTTLPFSQCAPGGLQYPRASDPAVSIGPDGTAYAISLSFDLANPRSAVVSAVSRDGGRTWTRVRTIAANSTDVSLDKEWITADPRRPGVAYAVWDDLSFTTDGHFRAPAYFSKTTDYGRTWSAPQAIAAKGLDQQTLGNQILVDRHTGRLYDTYAYYFCTCPSIPKVAFVYSDNHGRTWSRQHVVSKLLPVGVAQPGTGLPVRSGGLPFAAISRSGQLYLTWEDSRFSGGSYDEIAVSTSKDAGTHWTAPHRANRPTGRPAFTPSIAVTTSGKVAITYYDLRRDVLGDHAFSTDYWARTTSDGTHFTGDRHLAGSFDLTTAPFAGGLFVGDYEGLVAADHHFVSVFVKTNCSGPACVRNPTDVYSARFGDQLSGSAISTKTGATAEVPARAVAQHPNFLH